MNFRPRLSLLRNEDVERIISSAYDLLATTGVKIKHEEALQILSDHGASGKAMATAILRMEVEVN